ncbi:MAG: SIS domain-containing protein [Phycisphaerae bacterium]
MNPPLGHNADPMSSLASKTNPERGAKGPQGPDDVLDKARQVLSTEAAAIRAAADRLDHRFAEAVELIIGCPGRVAVTGVGKAGLIGNKIQATLASTGTPAYFLHPVEALHGDLGMIQPDDVVIALSRSGQTEELLLLLPVLKDLGCRIILLTADPKSRGAALSDIVVEIGDTPEACPLGLAPSSSAAAMLAVGDALALTIMDVQNVQPTQYAAYHPGGALGRSLMCVHQIMRTGDQCPTVKVTDTLEDYYNAVEPRRSGAAGVIDDNGKLIGIFTHGDLFRLHRKTRKTPHPAKVQMAAIMTSPCKSAHRDDRVADALRSINELHIDELPVIDDDGMLVGLIDIQDLVARGFSVFDAR